MSNMKMKKKLIKELKKVSDFRVDEHKIEYRVQIKLGTKSDIIS